MLTTADIEANEGYT